MLTSTRCDRILSVSLVAAAFCTATATITWASGLPSVRFRLSAGSVTLGEPVSLFFQSRNDSDQAVTVDLGGNFEQNVVILATFPDGHKETVRQPDLPGMVRIGLVRVAPHASAVQELLMNKLVDLRQTGNYTFQVQLSPPRERSEKGDAVVVDDDVLYLFVDSRDEARLTERCEKLLTRAMSPDAITSFEAISTFGYMRDRIVVSYLRRYLESDKTEGVDYGAFQSLALVGG